MQKKEFVYIGGYAFSNAEFEYLLNSFKVGFSVSSLSIEKAFSKQEGYEYEIQLYADEKNQEYYMSLPHPEKREIREILHQIIVFYGTKMGVFTDQLTDDKRQIERLYHEYFDYFEPYIYQFIIFDEKNRFDKVETYHNLGHLFRILPHLKQAKEQAYGMKIDNLEAFDYAMSLDEITIKDVMEINRIVNESDIEESTGYKTTNNDILTASFTPTDKENVPFEMQKLFSDYKNNFGLDVLDPYENGITYDEHLRRCEAIIKREALFHIRFERIHPFADGNGRTGRIIMNHNLLRSGLAPVIIPGVMSEEYKKYIDDFDVEGFTKYLLGNSSQQLTNWVALATAGIKVNKKNKNPKNEILAEMETNNAKNSIKKLIKSKNLILF